MTASYLFSSDGLIALARYVKPDTLFAFDLDIALLPITGEHVAEPVKVTLQRLMNVAKVTVITGRARNDALTILGFAPHLLIGNQGAEWPSQKNARNWRQVIICLKWRERLYDRLVDVQGAEIEFKGESVSLHFRNAADPEKAISLINAAIEELEPRPRRFDGTFIINLLPDEALTKEEALLSTMKHFESKRAIIFGYDESDEEIFRSRRADIFGIHFGEDSRAAASYCLSTQSEMLGLLNSMVGMLEITDK